MKKIIILLILTIVVTSGITLAGVSAYPPVQKEQVMRTNKSNVVITLTAEAFVGGGSISVAYVLYTNGEVGIIKNKIVKDEYLPFTKEEAKILLQAKARR